MARGTIEMFSRCPGAANQRTPTLTIKKCPKCGEEGEIFSNDIRVTCGNCRFVIYNDVNSCIKWCRYTERCVGPGLYKKLKHE